MIRTLEQLAAWLVFSLSVLMVYGLLAMFFIGPVHAQGVDAPETTDDGGSLTLEQAFDTDWHFGPARKSCTWVQVDKNGNSINSERYYDRAQCLAQSKNKIPCGPAECRPKETTDEPGEFAWIDSIFAWPQPTFAQMPRWGLEALVGPRTDEYCLNGYPRDGSEGGCITHPYIALEFATESECKKAIPQFITSQTQKGYTSVIAECVVLIVQ